MDLRKAFSAAAVAIGLFSAASAARPSVEIASQAPPHGTAPQQWLQRLTDAGAGPTRIVTRGGEPRVEELGESPLGGPLVKVYAVLTRDNTLLLPGEGGPRRYRLSDRAKLAEFFQRLAADGAGGVTTPRGRYGLSQPEFTDLFTRLQRPLPKLADRVTLQAVVDSAAAASRVRFEVDPAIAPVLEAGPEGTAAVQRLSIGSAVAALLSEEGLALQAYRPIGSPAVLRVVSAREAEDAWPVGYDPDRSPTKTAPVLMEFLTVEVEGYSLAEALNAIGPRLIWKDAPLPIVWDRFAMRSAGIDPTAVQVKFPSRRTFYKKLLDQLAIQARLRVRLRVDEAGTPFLWLTR